MQAVTLRQALGALANIPQFFAYRLTLDPAKPGKYAKVPWAEGGHAHDVQNAGYWHDYDGAVGLVERLRARGDAQYALGFAFTRDCGYAFVDVDHAIEGGNFTEIGAWVYNAFPGAFFEISSSGTGFHIIARAVATPHSCRDAERGIEFYTEDRGIAFGLSGYAFGSADVDATHFVNSYWIPTLFPGADRAQVAAEFAQARADWRGPADDEKLIERAMRSTSELSAFSGRATFADLWANDALALARTFPDASAADGINRSQADMALAQHLAFWTGCDAPRIERLMRRSALYRAKWDEHRTYLMGLTILGACRQQGKVLADKPVEDNAPIVTTDVTGATFLDKDAQRALFDGCVYVSERKAIFTPHDGGAQMLTSEQFQAWFGGYTFIMDERNDKVTRNAWEAFTQSQLFRFPKVHKTAFRPDLPAASTFTESNASYVNTYIAPNVRRIKGDPSPFLEHIKRLLPSTNDQAILIAYAAAVVQYPGIKFRWCPVLQGTPGNGKTIIGECVAYAVGEQYTYVPKADDLTDKFNDWMEGNIFVMVNDVYVPNAREEVIEALKPMITDERQQIQGKGTKKQKGRVVANFMMNMNKRDGLVKHKDDRRLAIFYTAQQCKADLDRDGMDSAYFVTFIDHWLKRDGYAIVADFLATYPIPDTLNPAKYATTAPRTGSEDEAINEGMGNIEHAILDAVQEGRYGFGGDWICWQDVGELIKAERRTMKPRMREEMLDLLGYVPHPALNKYGWTSNPVANRGCLRLFVKKGSGAFFIDSQAAVVANFVSAQIMAVGNKL